MLAPSASRRWHAGGATRRPGLVECVRCKACPPQGALGAGKAADGVNLPDADRIPRRRAAVRILGANAGYAGIARALELRADGALAVGAGAAAAAVRALQRHARVARIAAEQD